MLDEMKAPDPLRIRLASGSRLMSWVTYDVFVTHLTRLPANQHTCRRSSLAVNELSTGWVPCTPVEVADCGGMHFPRRPDQVRRPPH